MDDVWSKLIALTGQVDVDELSLGEVAEKLGLKHRSQAKHYKTKAENDGLIVRNTMGRLIPAPTESRPSLVTLPVMGDANCGPASIFASDQITGTISFSPSALKRKLRSGAFVVKAVGDSMNCANVNGKTIDDGDMVIVEPITWGNATDNDYVLSVIDGVANIKKFRIDTNNRQIILKSESRELFEDILIDAEDLYMYTIAGKVVDVVKKSV